MIYRWRCHTCDQVVEVHRRLAEYRVPPAEDEHRECKGTEFTKLVNVPANVFVLENEAQYWDDRNYKQPD